MQSGGKITTCVCTGVLGSYSFKINGTIYEEVEKYICKLDRLTLCLKS